MKEKDMFTIPSELELLEWFGCEPTKAEDGQYRYQVSDKSNVTLIFSFDVIQASIQTVVIKADVPVTKVVQESARKLWIQEFGGRKHLRAECLLGSHRVEMSIEIEPCIKVEWITLRETGR
jgi:hypothetical protein